MPACKTRNNTQTLLAIDMIWAAARRAGLPHVSPHMLRHSAAVHMAEAGIPMSEIAQMLGHANSRITESTYARYSPTYLRKAASALEYDEPRAVQRRPV
jgi:integrase